MINSKICVIGDTHFGISNNSDYVLENQLKYIKEELVPYLIKNGINTIVQLGDLFDNRNHINIKIKNAVLELFENEFSKFEFYIFPGNHDVYYKNTNDVTSLKILNRFENVKLIEKISLLSIKGKSCLFVPWQFDNSFQRYVEENLLDNVSVVFGHFDTIGARMNKTKVSEHGIDKKFLFQFPKVISGHYHTRSILSDGKNEIIYTGTPWQLRRDDANEERGVMILDMNSFDYEFIENKTSYRFFSFNYPEKFEERDISGNVIDLYVKDTEKQDEKLSEYISKIENLKPFSFTIRNINTFKNESTEDIKVKNIKELFEQYIEIVELESDIKDIVIKKLDELYQECQKEI